MKPSSIPQGRVTDPMTVVDSEYCIRVGTYEMGKGVPILVSTGLVMENRGLEFARAEHFTFFTEGEWRDYFRIRSDHHSWKAASLEIGDLPELSLEVGKNRLVGHLSRHYREHEVKWSGELDLSEGTQNFLRFLAFNDDTKERLQWVADSTDCRELTREWGRLIRDNFLDSLHVEEDSRD